MVGNRVFGHALIFGIAAALLFAPWGSVRIDVSRPPIEPVLEPIWIQATGGGTATLAAVGDGQPLAEIASQDLVFGWQGAIALGQVRIAYWTICLCLMGGALGSALNFLKCTRLPSLLVFACFGFSAACSLVAVTHHALLGSVGTGSVLALACALFGWLLSPADEAAEAAQMPLVEEGRRQFRSAA